MSEIIQLYKDEQKTTKVYPKTLASEVYVDENTTFGSQLEQLDNKITEINLKYPPLGLEGLKDDYFLEDGSINPNPTDNTSRLQNILNFYLEKDTRGTLPKFILPNGAYFINGTVSINKRYTNYDNCLYSIQIEGESNSTLANTFGGATLVKGGSGYLFRMCSTENGYYPDGDKNVVKPLQFLRTIKLKNINSYAINNTGTGFFGGRGIIRSEFENISLTNYEDGIILGKKNATVIEKNAEEIELDYCERNNFIRLNFRKVNNHIQVVGGDTTTVEKSFLSRCNDSSGKIFHFCGGNDFYTIKENIIHPSYGDNDDGISTLCRVETIRGIDLKDNHIEHLNGYLITGTLENFNCEVNLIKGEQQVAKYINLAYNKEYGLFNVNKNTIALPQPTTRFADITNLNTNMKCKYDDNKITTVLGGNETWEMKTSLDSLARNNGQWGNPINIGGLYLWNNDGKLMCNTIKPVSKTDGTVVGLQT